MRNLEVIGEAARSLSDEMKRQAPEAEWRKIAGLRNVLVHEYFAINITILWDIIQNKIDSLETTCRRLLATLHARVD